MGSSTNHDVKIYTHYEGYKGRQLTFSSVHPSGNGNKYLDGHLVMDMKAGALQISAAWRGNTLYLGYDGDERQKLAVSGRLIKWGKNIFTAKTDEVFFICEDGACARPQNLAAEKARPSQWGNELPPSERPIRASSSARSSGGASAWQASFTSYGVNMGARVRVDCPPGGGKPGIVYGSSPYTGRSRVCWAGVHSGVITPERGGTVEFEVVKGASSYAGSLQNGVRSVKYPATGRAFRVVDSKTQVVSASGRRAPDSLRWIKAGEPHLVACLDGGDDKGCSSFYDMAIQADGLRRFETSMIKAGRSANFMKLLAGACRGGSQGACQITTESVSKCRTGDMAACAAAYDELLAAKFLDTVMAQDQAVGERIVRGACASGRKDACSWLSATKQSPVVRACLLGDPAACAKAFGSRGKNSLEAMRKEWSEGVVEKVIRGACFSGDNDACDLVPSL